MAIGAIELEVKPDLSGFKRELSQQGGAAAEQAGKDSGGGFLSGFKSVALIGAAAAGTAIVAGLGIGAKVAGDLEQSQIAFETLFGNADKAKAFLGDLKTFAAQTPFELPGLTSAAQKLASAGIEADKILPIMSTLGDSIAAMGGSSENIDRATLALQQMALKGKVSGEEMLQLAEAGVPAWDALASKMGTSVADAQDKVSKGLVDYTTLYDALGEKSGAALQRSQGAMEKQAQSFQGLMSTLKDTLQIGLADAVGPALQALKPLLADGGALMETFGMVGKIIAPVGELLVNAFKNALPALQAVGGALARAFNTLGPAIGKVFDALGPVVSLIGEGLAKVVDALAPVLAKLAPLFARLIEAAMPLLEAILGPIVDVLIPALLPALDSLIAALDPVIAVFTDVAGQIAPILAQVLTVVATVLGQVLQALAPLIPSFIQMEAALLPLLPPLLELVAVLLPPLAELLLLVTKAIPPLVAASQLLTSILGFLAEKVAVVIGWLADLVSWLVDRLTPAISGVVDFGARLVRGLWDGISSMLGWLGQQVASVWNWIKDGFNFASKLYNAGVDLVRGLWNGVSSMSGWIKDKLKGFADSVVGFIKNPLSIFSPSRVMAREVGVPIVQGIALGFTQGTPGAVSSIQGDMSRIVGAASGVGSLTAAGLGGGLGAGSGAGGGPVISVYIGQQELTDIVRTEVKRSDDQLALTLSGRR
jgi:tape measure domain-containing protein